MTSSAMTEAQVVERITTLNVNVSGERRAPHKPLLLLVAISKLLQGQRELSFPVVEKSLQPLLNSYAPPVKSRHQPELPYWYLRSDQLWEISGDTELPLQKGDFPQMAGLRETSGRLDGSFADALLSDQRLTQRVIRLLLDGHFAESLHDDILSAVGLDSKDISVVMEAPIEYVARRRRDPEFRQKVLRAYEYRCAATGFRAALGGSFFGCEAAHVRWHAQYGPDTVENGMALEPTMHKLFDAGAWSLTDDREIIVSADFTGADETVERIRNLHMQPLRAPLQGMPLVSVDFIRWHREPGRGGVFRLPALT